MSALRAIAAALLVAIGFGGGGTAAQPASTDAVHLGVATCAGSNCHGASERQAGAPIAGNEYNVWSKRDKHRKGYTVLLEERALRIARAIGLPDAVNQKLCLDCHTDNVPQAQRGRQFQLSDGVGCEACHGGASGWLGIHISGASHREMLAAGMYPTEQPVARAEKCLGCHFGDDTRFVDHRLIGAGHPRLGFELGSFTAMQPAHFVADARYFERKGRITDLQVWAVGQAVALIRRMEALLDPRRAHRGLFPELALYDCGGCHHAYDTANAPKPTATGLGPGRVKLDDANAVMLQAAAAKIFPTAARSLGTHLAALHRATDADAAAVPREAKTLRDAARGLLSPLAGHEFTIAEIRALIEALLALGKGPDGWRFSHAEQTAMALESAAAALRSAEPTDPQQQATIKKSLDALFGSFSSEASFRPEAFDAALREFQRAIR